MTMEPRLCWLVEAGNLDEPFYWTGIDGQSFASDYRMAIRFSRKEDADTARANLIDKGLLCRSVQHELTVGEQIG